MIGTGAFIGMGIMLGGGILLPLAVCIWWLVSRKEKITTVLIGAATWFVFAMLLESIPKYILFNPATSLGQTVLGNAALFSVLGALLAGLFEETGRFVAFKTLLKKRTNRETAISHGIGHGGFEAMFLMGMAGVQDLIYASMIASGAFDTVVEQTRALGVDVSALEALPAQLAAITPVTGLLNIVERVFAMLLHVALSILVFYAVRESKTWIWLLAILVHALVDVPAALYQAGVLNLYVTEVLLAVYGTLIFVLIYRVFYRKMN